MTALPVKYVTMDLKEAKVEFDKQYIISLMVRFDGCIVRMAKVAGVNRECLTRLIKKYELRAALAESRHHKYPRFNEK